MSQMVRKQIYIYKRQEEQLKRISEARGVSEAEIVRQAIDREAFLPSPMLYASDAEAFERLMALMSQPKSYVESGEAHRWTRADYYDDPRSKRLLGEA
ncbi:MAG: hypothetical protein OHK0041_14040 [Anaerolineales bacterium]